MDEEAKKSGNTTTEETVVEQTSESTEAVKPKTKGEVVIADTSEEVEEPKSEDKTEDGETAKKEEGAKEDSSLKDDSKEDSNQTEGVKKRIAQVTEKFGTEAKLWQATQKKAAEDPEFRLLLIKKLEEEGVMEQGSFDMAKKQLDESKKKVETEEPEQIAPEVEYLRKIYYQEQEKQYKETMRREGVIQEFEEKHPDIAEHENAPVIRSRIGVLEQTYREQGMNETEALEAAYETLFNRQALLEREREKGEVAGQIKAEIKSIASTPSTSGAATTKSLRKLTRDEEEARLTLGMTVEEYIEHKDAMSSSE